MTSIQPLDRNDKSKNMFDNNFSSMWEGKKVAILLGGIVLGAALSVIYEIGLICYETIKDLWDKVDFKVVELDAIKKYSKEFIDKIKNLDKIDSVRLIKRLALSGEEEKQILKSLQEQYDISENDLQEILLGAHVKLEDGGEMYDLWSSFKKAKERISSHPSVDVQYSVEGKVIKEMLFGTIEDNGSKCTWFQLENHPTTFGYLFRHTFDYLVYKLSGHNQGPFGSSPLTDRNPIVLRKKPPLAV